MSNEELALQIKAGNTELYAELWKNTEKLMIWKINKLYDIQSPRFARAGLELDDLKQLVQHSLDFLTHSLSQGVGLASGEPCQLARQKHHLLLVHGHSVGVVAAFLHLWKVVFYGLRTLLFL